MYIQLKKQLYASITKYMHIVSVKDCQAGWNHAPIPCTPGTWMNLWRTIFHHGWMGGFSDSPHIRTYAQNQEVFPLAKSHVKESNF